MLSVTNEEKKEVNEPVLDDDYPVFWDYAYVCDGVPSLSPIKGTVRELKRALSVSEVRRYDFAGRARRENVS